MFVCLINLLFLHVTSHVESCFWETTGVGTRTPRGKLWSMYDSRQCVRLPWASILVSAQKLGILQQISCTQIVFLYVVNSLPSFDVHYGRKLSLNFKLCCPPTTSRTPAPTSGSIHSIIPKGWSLTRLEVGGREGQRSCADHHDIKQESEARCSEQQSSRRRRSQTGSWIIESPDHGVLYYVTPWLWYCGMSTLVWRRLWERNQATDNLTDRQRPRHCRGKASFSLRKQQSRQECEPSVSRNIFKLKKLAITQDSPEFCFTPWVVGLNIDRSVNGLKASYKYKYQLYSHSSIKRWSMCWEYECLFSVWYLKFVVRWKAT